MPRHSPFPIVLTGREQRALEDLARKYTSPYFMVVRAKAILLAAQGLRNDQIADRISLPRQIISKWRKRFFEERLDGLENLPRPGRPPVFPPELIMQVKALACELPHQHGLPLSRYSGRDLVREVARRGLVASISGRTLWRWLDEDAIRPWQHRSWIFPRDPDFQAKAERVLGLYQGLWNDQALGADDYIISADEKTSIQARLRLHPTLPPQPQQSMRVEFEYERGGALAYLAAWDVRRAKVFGRCESTTGIEPFDRLVQQVMEQEPYRKAPRVFWIVDNGSSHRGAASVRRLQGDYPNLILVHLPVHASWLNQVEIYFSVIQRMVLTPNDFSSLAQVAERLLAFQHFYEKIAQPFQWKFTRADLCELMQKTSQPTPIALAA
jgi:transposase